jgi:predicted aconitase
VAVYVTTSRFVAGLAAQKGFAGMLERAGVTVLVDTCTYFAPAVRAARGRVMTNSAKWAYYAPGLLPVEVAFGSLEDCIETAISGEVTRRNAVWSDHAWGL